MSSTLSAPRKTAWMIWIIASIFYTYQYILRVLPNIMLSDIMQQFNIDAAALGQFSGVYYLGYSLMHLPVGIMLDHYGPRRVMTGCILLTVAGLMPLLFADHWTYPVIGRFLIGAGSSAAILGVFKIIRMTFSQERFSRMLSFSVTIGLLGAIYGGAPMSYMRDTFGYATVIQFLAVAGVALAAITYWIVPNTERLSKNEVLSDVKEVLTNGRVICCCIFAGMMIGPLEGFADVWGTVFLIQTRGLDSILAASLPSMIFIGMCFGGPLLNAIAEKTGSYLGTIIGAGIVMAISFFAILTWHMNSSMLSINFLLVGICCAYQILAIYKASTYVREEVSGLTTAVANMIIMVFGYAFHTAIGGVINSTGGPNVSQALIYGVAVVPVAVCLGSLGFVLLFFMEKRANRKNT